MNSLRSAVKKLSGGIHKISFYSTYTIYAVCTYSSQCLICLIIIIIICVNVAHRDLSINIYLLLLNTHIDSSSTVSVGFLV